MSYIRGFYFYIANTTKSKFTFKLSYIYARMSLDMDGTLHTDFAKSVTTQGIMTKLSAFYNLVRNEFLPNL